MKRLLMFLGTMPFYFGAVGFANASLFDRGGGLIYCDTLDSTWLQDANFAGSRMVWWDALAWADQLVYGGYDDWQLPSALNQDGTGPDWGNVTGSEMGHIYYTELGNTSGVGGGLTNTGPFYNLQPSYYWSRTQYAANPDNAWFFFFDGGGQGADSKDYFEFYAWAVRPGDVPIPVPEPATVLLLGSGGLVSLGLNWRKKGRRHFDLVI